MDPFILLNTILAALSALFAIATFLLGLVAFLGWENLKSTRARMATAEKEINFILSGAKKEMESVIKKSQEISSDLDKNKAVGKKSVESLLEFQTKTENLMKKLDSIRTLAQSKIGSINSVIASSASPTLLINPLTGMPIENNMFLHPSGFDYSSALSGDVVCKKCGKRYLSLGNYHFSVSSVDAGTTKCPYCGKTN